MKCPEGSRIIQLTQGYECIVDEADYDYLSQWSWQAHHSRSDVYARAVIKRRSTRMHRLILGIMDNPDKQGDHVNRDTLDNRRSNLQIVSPKENAANRRPRPVERKENDTE